MGNYVLHSFFADKLLFQDRIWRVQIRSDKANYQKHNQWHCEKHYHSEPSSLANKLVLDEQPEDEIDSENNTVADDLGGTGPSTKSVEFLVLLILLSHVWYYKFERSDNNKTS